MDTQKKYITNNFQETQTLGKKIAIEILSQKTKNSALILALQGDLGAGKTTFLQGFAMGLGIKEKILSPTFIIMKKFKIQTSSLKMKIKNPKFTNFYHFDCYRLDKPKEILELSFKEIILNPENIIAIEWPEKIKSLLPKNLIIIKFKHFEENKREIIIDNF